MTGYTHWTYSIESALHEYFLQSPHRTLDPEQADFFYVPVYTSCFFHPVLGWADYPYWYGNGGGCPQTPSAHVACDDAGLLVRAERDRGT